jgi:hypothetical protein
MKPPLDLFEATAVRWDKKRRAVWALIGAALLIAIASDWMAHSQDDTFLREFGAQLGFDVPPWSRVGDDAVRPSAAHAIRELGSELGLDLLDRLNRPGTNAVSIRTPALEWSIARGTFAELIRQPAGKKASFVDKVMRRPDLLESLELRPSSVRDVTRWVRTLASMSFYLWIMLWVVMSLRQARAHPVMSVLILRPFQDVDTTVRLKAITRRYLTQIGHAFLLEDKAWIPLVSHRVVGLLALFSIPLYALAAFVLQPPAELIRVRNRSGVRRLMNKLSNHRRFSFRFYFRGGVPYSVRSVDRWWQDCASTMIDAADVIIVDLSQVRAGGRWELDRIRELNAQKKALCISWRRRRRLAGDVVADWVGDMDDQISLHCYDDNAEFEHPQLFREAIDRAYRGT